MPELEKRLNAGYVLMDSYTKSDNSVCYFLERGKLKCMIELDPTGHGWLYTSNNTRRI